MTVKIGINGFGRIGRCILSHIYESRRTDLKVVKINATGPLETSAHLMRYDSIHGRFSGKITTENGNLNMGDGPIKMFSSYDPTDLDWKNKNINPASILDKGDKIDVKVMEIDLEERKVSLSKKHTTENPWKEFEDKHNDGDILEKLKVKSVTDFGVFVELEEGVDGLIYISDLSWTKKIKHPREFCNTGENIEVVVLELDVDNRKLSLGHKQLSENPWNKYLSLIHI